MHAIRRNHIQQHIRNFAIIAHIDHGKSTLADRLLEVTGAITAREYREQFLDDMDLERERGITIKARAVQTTYRAQSGTCYQLNLIDTPGHVDFNYEVSRSLAACEGVLLLVDVAQGVEAQTIANASLALEHDLAMLSVLNKIDLPNADIEGTKRQIEDVIGIDASDALQVSAKQGDGVQDVLEAIVARIPPPQGNEHSPLKAIIMDSWFDDYQGVLVLTRIIDGNITAGLKLQVVSTGKVLTVGEVGIFTPKREKSAALNTGEVGYVVCGIKQVGDISIGDTLTEAARPTATPCPGYREPKPMVFCGLYSSDTEYFEDLRDSLEKLCLNDASIRYEPENSLALGFGFRCGFLGLLHMEIIQERLEREYGLDLISTTPTVVYKVTLTDNSVIEVDNPAKLPDPHHMVSVEEPYVDATIMTPEAYIGPLLALCQERRGSQNSLTYTGIGRVLLSYRLPLNEIVLDFYDRLKSCTQGYASFDYEFAGYQLANVVKVDILVNGESIDALSFVAPREVASFRARRLAERMKEEIPQQLYEVAIQAAIGHKIIVRETVKALRKDVTAKCYGGDITRKRKLWAKQKEGKKRMKQVGRVTIPQKAFLALLRINT